MTQPARLCALAGALLLLVPLGMLVDLPVARLFLAARAPAVEGVEPIRLPGGVRRVLELSEVFAHGLGAGAILFSAWLLDPAGRRRLPRLLACTYGAGGAALLLKLLVTRARPYHFFDFPEGFHRAYGGVLTTFSMWGTEMGSRVQSMPSGHTATAVGLAIGLCWAYPRAWGWFLALAVLATLQRIECGAHFVSDTLAAAALACAVGAICFSPRLLGGRFTELESSNSGATTRP